MDTNQFMRRDYTKALHSEIFRSDFYAREINRANEGKDLSTREEYQEVREAYIKDLSGRRRDDRLISLEFYMANAVAYGRTTKDRNWVFYFLPAYDLLVQCTLGGKK